MKHFIGITLALTIGLAGSAFAQGKNAVVVVGDMVSVWDDTPSNFVTEFRVGGSGQINGEFTVVRRNGIEIGLRATDRTDGLLTAFGKRQGVYEAATGFDPGTCGDCAEWNYDFHVDLSETDTTLIDYDLTLVQTFAPKLGGESGQIDLAAREAFPGLTDLAVLYQSSQNPTFFDTAFDPTVEGTYHLKLTLKPVKGGPPLIAQIRVIVRDDG